MPGLTRQSQKSPGLPTASRFLTLAGKISQTQPWTPLGAGVLFQSGALIRSFVEV